MPLLFFRGFFAPKFFLLFLLHVNGIHNLTEFSTPKKTTQKVEMGADQPPHQVLPRECQERQGEVPRVLQRLRTFLQGGDRHNHRAEPEGTIEMID